MSQQQDKIKTEEEHTPAVEAGEEAHLEDVIPTADAASEANDDSDESIEAQLDKAQATIKDYWDQMIRLRAEIENNRKRAERDVANAHKYALKNFTENLIPVVDSMEMGQAAANAESASLESIREGTELTTNMLMQVLERSGVQQIDPTGEKFDPDRHQAISMVESAEVESNRVIEVMQKGYLLNDRLIRPAMVIVAK
jgi:molecular chaperone GrpE